MNIRARIIRNTCMAIGFGIVAVALGGYMVTRSNGIEDRNAILITGILGIAAFFIAVRSVVVVFSLKTSDD